MIQAAVRRMERVSPRAWRWIALVYWAALTAGTHWPSLRLGRPGLIPVDKILHAGAFAGVCGLLMLTRWLDRPGVRPFTSRNINRACLAAAILAALDEITQSWVLLDRFAKLDDFIADAVGILIAWLVATLLFQRVSA